MLLLTKGGGLVRDEHGSWIGGFTRYIGSTNSFIVELWGFREGLLLCCNLNIDFLRFVGDGSDPYLPRAVLELGF